jgi:hypothetical protein
MVLFAVPPTASAENGGFITTTVGLASPFKMSPM